MLLIAASSDVPLRPPKARGRKRRPLGTSVMVYVKVVDQRLAAAAAAWSGIVAARLGSAPPKKRIGSFFPGSITENPKMIFIFSCPKRLSVPGGSATPVGYATP